MGRTGDWLGRLGGRDRPEPPSDATPYSWGGRRDPSAVERALIRDAAEKILVGEEPRESWKRGYRRMARGTLAALDWLEGRRDTAPSSGRAARPGDSLPGKSNYRSTGFSRELGDAEDWASGWVKPPTEDMDYHGAVWSLLGWWMEPGRDGGIAIDVPGLPGNPTLDDSDSPGP